MNAMAASGPPLGADGGNSDRVRFCKLVDMGPLTGWKDPALGIGDAVWVASTDSPNDSGVILPVNEAARTYDPITGVDVDVFQSVYADAASEAEGALADCG